MQRHKMKLWLLLQASVTPNEKILLLFNTHLASSAPGPLVHHSAPTTPKATLAATPKPPSGNGIDTIYQNAPIQMER
jgi:hypothetical protein